MLPHITEEQVIEGMLKFAAAQSKSEFVPSVLRGVDTRMLPMPPKCPGQTFLMPCDLDVSLPSTTI